MFDIGKEEIAAITKVFENRQFMRYRGGEGGFTETFEKDLCQMMDMKYALTVNSGTSALIAALAALGIGPGDEVIVPAYTWVATALAPIAVGAVPIMAEINESLTIDPEDIRKKITPYTKAIIPVHMRNLPCDMTPIMEIAKEYNLLVIEDACQAIGTTYKGKKVGTIGDVGVFSFNQYKTLSCGEGGAVVTNISKVYERALIYHDAGAYTRNYAVDMKEPFFAGVNYRVSEIQGAILGVQLKRLDKYMEALKERTAIAREMLSNVSDCKLTPHNDPLNAIALSLTYATREDFEKARGKDSQDALLTAGDRHVYTNWEPIMKQQVVHEKMNPYKWANRDIKYTADMCPKTLDILSRTVWVDAFDVNTPIDEVKTAIKKHLI
jgi:dTDP-4-amino-4,6-dideoxygalactose transaminase